MKITKTQTKPQTKTQTKTPLHHLIIATGSSEWA